MYDLFFFLMTLNGPCRSRDITQSQQITKFLFFFNFVQTLWAYLQKKHQGDRQLMNVKSGSTYFQLLFSFFSMIRSHSCLTNGFHIVHETTREFVNKLPISDHKENDPTLCIIVFSLHISILKHPQSVHNHTMQCSNINVSPLLT